jgi:hypothetical protein
VQIIDELEMKKSPGQLIQLYEFQGRLWRQMTGPDGERQSTKSKEPYTILIASPTMWEAHEYVHTHISALIPKTISHRGDIWLTLDLSGKTTAK